MDEALSSEMREALDRVVDPCSNAMGVPLGLGAMGLVSGVERSGSELRVHLRLTSPCCAYGPTMAGAAAAELRHLPALDGVTVSVDVDHGAVWTPADMAPAAKELLAERRRRTIAVSAAQPYDWTRKEMKA